MLKLYDGDVIRMRLLREKEWLLGRVIGEEGVRFYLVEVNGKYYRRNRKWFRVIFEELLELVEINFELTDFIELVELSLVELL